MRREKIIKIDGKPVTVKELKAQLVIELLEGEGDDGINILVGIRAGRMSDMKKLIFKSMEMSAAEFDDIAGGIDGFTALEEAFREVNASFFASLSQRITNFLEKIKEIEGEMKRFSKSPVSSLRKAT